jgi:hypothetical protein
MYHKGDAVDGAESAETGVRAGLDEPNIEQGDRGHVEGDDVGGEDKEGGEWKPVAEAQSARW